MKTKHQDTLQVSIKELGDLVNKLDPMDQSIFIPIKQVYTNLWEVDNDIENA